MVGGILDRPAGNLPQQPRRRLLEPMAQAMATRSLQRGFAHHLLVQFVAPALRLLMLFRQFDHLSLQFHQPTVWL